MNILTILYIGYLVTGVVFYTFKFETYYSGLNTMETNRKLFFAVISIVFLPTALVVILLKQLRAGY